MKTNPYDLDGVYSGQEEKDTLSQIRACVKANIPAFLHGKPGVGKTARVKELDPDCEVLELSLVPIEDLLGTEVVDSHGKIKRIMPTWLESCIRKCNEEPDKTHILFLDELTNADLSIQTLAYSLILDRTVAKRWKLPENLRIIAAGNEVEDSIAAEEIPKPLKNRMAHIKVEPNVNEWVEWAMKKGIDYRVINFIKRNPEYLCYSNNKSIYISPRTWERVSKVLKRNCAHDTIFHILGEDSEPRRNFLYQEGITTGLGNDKKMETINTFLQCDIPVFLHGKPGEGKSQRVMQIDPDCTTLELSLVPIEDLTGTAVYDENGMHKKMPVWLEELYEKCKREPDKTHILFLDELTNAVPAIQKLAYSLVLEKKVANTWNLPDNVRIVAAGNEVEDSSVAEEIPKPLQDRFVHLNANTTIDEWIEWALNNNIDPIIMAFAASDNGIYLRRKTEDKSFSRITPRTWERASRLFSSTKDFETLKLVLGEEMFGIISRFYSITVPDESKLFSDNESTITSAFAFIPYLLQEKEIDLNKHIYYLSKLREGKKAIELLLKLMKDKRVEQSVEKTISDIEEEKFEVRTREVVYRIHRFYGDEEKVKSYKTVVDKQEELEDEESDIPSADLEDAWDDIYGRVGKNAIIRNNGKKGTQKNPRKLIKNRKREVHGM